MKYLSESDKEVEEALKVHTGYLKQIESLMVDFFQATILNEDIKGKNTQSSVKMFKKKGDKNQNLVFTDEVQIMLDMINEQLLAKFEKKKYNSADLTIRDSEMGRIILSLIFHNIRKVIAKSKIFLNPIIQ